MTYHSRHETPHQRWERKRSNFLRLLLEVNTLHAGEGSKWCAKMHAYYTRRLEVLEAHEPERE